MDCFTDKDTQPRCLLYSAMQKALQSADEVEQSRPISPKQTVLPIFKIKSFAKADGWVVCTYPVCIEANVQILKDFSALSVYVAYALVCNALLQHGLLHKVVCSKQWIDLNFFRFAKKQHLWVRSKQSNASGMDAVCFLVQKVEESK